MPNFQEEINEFLAHHGVKGMKWGVINDKDSKGSGSKSFSDKSIGQKTAFYKSISKENISKKDVPKKALENQKKLLAKANLKVEDKQSSKKGWRPTQDQVILGIAGAALVGYLVYSGVKTYKLSSLPKAGAPVKLDHLQFLTQMSKGATWFKKGYITPESYITPDFTIPKGNVFHRISTQVEKGFSSATYATSNVADYNRYLSVFRHEKGSKNLHHITFKSKEDIRVPSLLNRLEAMRSVLTDQLGYDKSLGYEAAPSDALWSYKRQSGGNWADNEAVRFFKKLTESGYDAIIDDMDAGVIGESPLVIFNPGKFTEKMVDIISNADIQYAESSLTEILNRKT